MNVQMYTNAEDEKVQKHMTHELAKSVKLSNFVRVVQIVRKYNYAGHLVCCLFSALLFILFELWVSGDIQV